MSAISDKYASLGGPSSFLGAPATPETKCPDDIGMYQHYAQGGSIYWSPSTGAHVVYGLIRQKWATLGWEKSPLGYPTSDETQSPTKKGRYNTFQNGAILWKNGAAQAFESHGAIRAHWGNFSYENGFLGFPLTDETSTPDGVGRFNHFEGGSIYWKPSIDAHEVHGVIREWWAEGGWERNPQVGYPISDEQPTQSGSSNRYSDFENGVIYWKSGSQKAMLLSRFTIDNASQDFATVSNTINNKVAAMITGADTSIYLKNGPSCDGIADYSFANNTVQNRNYSVDVSIGYQASFLGWDGGLPDPHSDLNLHIQLTLDKANHRIIYYLTYWHVHTEVPFPTSIGVSASDIDQRLGGVLNSLLGQPNVVATLPTSPFTFLSAKTQPNGDFDLYIEPV